MRRALFLDRGGDRSLVFIKFLSINDDNWSESFEIDALKPAAFYTADVYQGTDGLQRYILSSTGEILTVVNEKEGLYQSTVLNKPENGLENEYTRKRTNFDS